MIIVIKVEGNVLVDDVKNKYQQQARVGLELHPQGDYLIATNRSSSVVIAVGDKILKLGPSTYLRLRGNRTWSDKHSENWSDAKRFIGRLWARIAKDSPLEDATGGGGVRG